MKKHSMILTIFCLLILYSSVPAEEKKKENPLVANPSLKLSGYTQAMYSYLDDGIDGFRIRRARLKLNGQILENISYNLQI